MMKKASAFEKVAARCWNILNEGKPFTPVFVIGTFIVFQWLTGAESLNGAALFTCLLAVIPLFAVYFVYDFPLHLRKYLWIPFIAASIWMHAPSFSLIVFSLALYFFFTIIFWGTIYYHLRIGTTLWNFTRFWKLVLKNSDSTSGNAQEQIPKILTLFAVFQGNYEHVLHTGNVLWMGSLTFTVAVFLYSFLLHHFLFTWKPEEIASYTSNAIVGKPLADKVVMVVIDGCRKDRLAEANTPFLDWLTRTGVEYTQMETVYPARTVVCFSSMYTGTYPREHGIKSNMVYKLGVCCESIFDSLRKVGKTGRLLAVAHLVDALGDDVDTYTAVTNNDVVDRLIVDRAKNIMEEKNPELLIAQLISTDQTGHSRGALYEEYKQKIEEADALIADFYHWLEDRGLMENTAFIVAADHGQSDGIGGHGHLDEGERFVPFILHGPMIKQGKKITAKHSLVSVASTMAYLLGAPFPNKSRGPVLLEAIREEDEVDENEEMHYRYTGA